MGALTKLSLDEIVPTLHVLEGMGVTAEQFRMLRADPVRRARAGTMLGSLFGPISVGEQLEWWHKLYRRLDGAVYKSLRFSCASTPEPDHGRLVINAAPFPLLLAAMRKDFKVVAVMGEVGDNITSARNNKQSSPYVAWCGESQEVGQQYRGVNPLTIEVGDDCYLMTLEERLLLGWYYWHISNGQMLDISGTTICAGSRDDTGRIPCVCWDTKKQQVVVHMYRPKSPGVAMESYAATGSHMAVRTVYPCDLLQTTARL